MPQDESEARRQSLYDALHRIAEKQLANEAPGHSLQPTLLANDAFIKLLEQRNVDQEDRSQVMAVGANVIRRLLVDHARRRRSAKRGGHQGRGAALEIEVADNAGGLDVIELHDALAALGRRPGSNSKQIERVVEMKFFGGLTNAEIAEQLAISEGTVNHHWKFAKAWLHRQLSSGA